VSAAYRAARYGVAFNAMSRHVDWERDDFIPLGLDEVAAFLKRDLTPTSRSVRTMGCTSSPLSRGATPQRAPQSAGAEWWKQ